MKSYKAAANAGLEIILKYLNDRMLEKKIIKKELAKNLQVSESTILRYFKKQTPLPLTVYLEICGILKLRPYLVPAEKDANEMIRQYFN